MSPVPDPTTGLIHHPYRPPGGFEAPQEAVHKASTVFFPSVAALRARDWKHKDGYTYGLHGTPTTFTLEDRLATLEGGTQCLLVPSGLAAIATVNLAMLGQGDEVLLPDNVYGPSKQLAQMGLARWGITHQLYDAMNPADLAARITPRTRLVWLEAAGSVTMEFPDLTGLVRVCRQHGVPCAIDNTWGAGLAFDPFALVDGTGATDTAGTAATAGTPLGVDISIHALTKYPSGGGDVLMGSIVTREAALHQRIKLTHMGLGTGVGANDAELVLRSLPSMALRYRAHDHAARSLAQWLGTQPQIAQVLHPALAGSPGHSHWQAVCGASGLAAGLFSVMIDARHTQEQVDRFCESLRLFRLGYSWGGPVSLVVPYVVEDMRGGRPAHLRPGTLVRFSVGLEAVEDLRADLEQALAALR